MRKVSRSKKYFTVNIGTIRKEQTWAEAVLVIREYGKHGLEKTCRVRLDSPWDVARLRRELNGIEQVWKEMLEAAKS